jgi:Ca2+-binding RTX toxin-like protein
VTVDIGFSNGVGGDAEGDSFVSIENVTASNFADGVWGSEEDNHVFLWWGDDYADGRGGVDTLNGGGGNDILVGGGGGDALGGDAGNDNIIGGTGDDWMWGGSGSDAFWVDADSLERGGHDRIMDFQDAGAEGTDYIRFDAVRYDQLIWYEQGTSAIIQIVLDQGGSHYVEVKNATLAAIADQYYGHG